VSPIRRTLLLTASGLLVLAAVASLAPGAVARTLKPGTLRARWPIKTSEPANGPSHPKDVKLADLLALGDIPGVAAQDPNFQSKRIPTPVNGLHEGDIIRTKGWVHVIAMDDDGDYHLQVSDSPTSGNHCFIVELPMDKAAFEKDASLRALSAKLRPFLRDTLLHDVNRQPSAGGNWMKGQAYMSITGQLFFDDWHVGGAARGVSPNGHVGKAATLWEIHPVTDIRFTKKP